MDRVESLRREIALSCRVLAREGVVQGSLGHVSARTERGILLRCRGPGEAGLLFTEPRDVIECDLAGRPLEPTEWRPPGELHLHAAVYRARAEVMAVVHAHPPAVVTADLAAVPLRPVFGAFNISAARLVAGGVPVYPRALLVDSAELGRGVTDVLAERDACILRGHGTLVCGTSVSQATIRTLDLESVAKVCLEIARAGAEPRPIDDGDLASLPDLGDDFSDGFAWTQHTRLDDLRARPPGRQG